MKKNLQFLKIFCWFIPIFIGIFLKTFVFTTVNVSGESMSPSIKDNQKMIISRIDKKYERGEIIVFSSKGNDPTRDKNEEFYIKRIIGIPGDTVEYKSGKLYVNNKEVNQSFLEDSSNGLINSKYEKSDGTSMPENNDWNLKTLSYNNGWNEWSKHKSVVPKNSLFVMGDHRSNSKDSRYFGYIKFSSIKGVIKTMPFSDNHANKVIKDVPNNFFVK